MVVWTLWHRDTFDRDTPISREAWGFGLKRGLRRLWQANLSEGIDETGARSFSSFTLDWGGGTASKRAHIDTFRTEPLMTLRGWTQQQPAILRSVAAAHARLIRSYRPTVTSFSGQEESSAILTAIEEARDLDQFERGLDTLTLVDSPD